MATNDDSATVAQFASEAVVAAPTVIDVIDVAGAESASYLHGQLSQDVEGLTVGQTRWTLLLQPQGKVDAWMRIHRVGPEQFLLLVDEGYGSDVKARLERFKLRVDATIETSTRPILALRGPASAELAASLELEDGVTVVSADWGGSGVDLIAGPGSEPAVELPAEVLMASSDDLEMIRVQRGRPAMGAELSDSTIPAAAGVVQESVDFTKGCYVGQELVARIDSRGNNTPTRLVRLALAGPVGALSSGTDLVDGETVVGTVTSVTRAPGDDDRAIGLGYVKRGTEVPGEAKVIDTNGQPVDVALRPLQN